MSSGNTVAVKEMLEVFPDPVQHEKAVQQFKGEFNTLSALDHSGLPKVWSYFEDSGKHYLVMDFVDATSLEHVVNQMDGLPPEGTVLKWLSQLLDVLEYLHARQPPVIFRDLRPSNIMLTTDNNIKLIDFGIAKMLNPGQQGRTLFRAVGSPEYAPPEQFGMSRSDARTDIYALGASLYFMLTKTAPPQAADRVIRNAPLVRIRDVNPSVSEASENAIYKMMAIKPADRPPSMTDIKQMLGPQLAAAAGGAYQPPVQPTTPTPSKMPPAADASSSPPVPSTRYMGGGGPASGGEGGVPPTRVMTTGGGVPTPPPAAAAGGAGFQVPSTRMMPAQGAGGASATASAPSKPSSGVFAGPTKPMSSESGSSGQDPWANQPVASDSKATANRVTAAPAMADEEEASGGGSSPVARVVIVLLLILLVLIVGTYYGHWHVPYLDKLLDHKSTESPKHVMVWPNTIRYVLNEAAARIAAS
jgi:serine/threonine-protein kinase